MEKKYELTEETIEWTGFTNGSRKAFTLHRIKALKDFSGVKKGDLGGFVEKESNLAQDGDCWVYDDAAVYDNAEIYGNAKVFDNAEIGGYARVHDEALVCDNAAVYGNACVYGKAIICDNVNVGDYAAIGE